MNLSPKNKDLVILPPKNTSFDNRHIKTQLSCENATFTIFNVFLKENISGFNCNDQNTHVLWSSQLINPVPVQPVSTTHITLVFWSVEWDYSTHTQSSALISLSWLSNGYCYYNGFVNKKYADLSPKAWKQKMNVWLNCASYYFSFQFC